jgi:hypothetical protein
MGGRPELIHSRISIMDAVDGSGMAAYYCGRDRTPMQAVPDAPGVLRCARCGHRTDLPGAGVLADGFDVVHRQWGLRGDPHVWEALRTAVGGDPTPADPAEVQAAFSAGLRRVAGIDVESGDGQAVQRGEFAHGGMSSGMVDVGWWRDRGVPLLVQRAVQRRPARLVARPSVISTVLVWILVLAIPAACLGGGGWLLYQRAVGTPVRATVLSCETSANWSRYAPRATQSCVAQWSVDGRIVVGNFDGGDGASDVGRTVDATVRGDTAYSRSLGLPIVLIALGLPIPIVLLLARRRRRAR